MSEGSVRFTFENREIECADGTSVAGALLAQGTTILTRSFKYHRARGYTCGYGVCPNCPLTIDGVPGVLSCTTPAKDGMVVSRERGWPSASWDIFEASALFSRLLTAGFQFRYFARYPRLAHLFETVMAHIAGAGRIPTAAAADRLTTRVFPQDNRIPFAPDVVVVGGGLSGCQAAISAACAGATVVLVNDGPLGGRSLAGRCRVAVDAAGIERRVDRLADELITAVRAMTPAITVIDGTAVGWFEGGVMPVVGDGVQVQLRPASLVVAAGSYEIADLYAGNDLPGTMLQGAAERLLHRENVRPGNRAVVVTDSDAGLEFADELTAAGITVELVVDKRVGVAPAARHAVVTGARVVRARGRRAVRGVDVRHGDGRIFKYRCDLVVHALGERPAEELRTQWIAQHSAAATGMWTVGSACVEDRGTMSALQHAAHVGLLAAKTALAQAPDDDEVASDA